MNSKVVVEEVQRQNDLLNNITVIFILQIYSTKLHLGVRQSSEMRTKVMTKRCGERSLTLSLVVSLSVV